MSKWCVIGHNSDEEYWVYGHYNTLAEANELAYRLIKVSEEQNMKIEYEIGEFFEEMP